MSVYGSLRSSVCFREFPGQEISGNRKKSRFKREIPGFPGILGFFIPSSFPGSFLPGNMKTLLRSQLERFSYATKGEKHVSHMKQNVPNARAST